MTDKIIRFFKIIHAIQARPGISAKELANICETTDRTIYRDLRLLDHIAPVTNEGYGRGYRFIGNFSMYPLNFTEQEALVFSMLPSIIDSSKLPSDFDSAYNKVMATHATEKSRHKDIIENITEIIQMGTPAYREQNDNFLYPIIQASLSQTTIDTVYHTQSRNKTTARKIDPYFLVPREQRFYVIGYCHLKGEVRTFRLSRFRKVELTNKSFHKGDFTISQYLKNTWSIERGEELISFKVKFSAEVARYVKEEEMFVRPKMTDLPDGGLLFEVTISREREFLNWVYQYGPAAEILEPKAIRDKVKVQLEQWMDKYIERTYIR
ncbi:transcriptional regulator [Paenibacillus profundus]|uniref:Transcriptional regulator n=1 Tax=Paenibacillus profundus TaxID=1173085 RepID=A0ABS8YNY1_9BACL|nr:WYL domain-containing transcriptional regulator [Paenibacillus profundus]MCE5173518.1 transcriptional regulator [Paenibacillus profundus]